MKHAVLSLTLGAALALVPSLAHADGRGWLGADFELLPQGSIEISGFGGSSTADTQTAYAVAVVAESQINDLVTIGLAPRYVFNVIGKDNTGDAATQLDLRARVTVGKELVKKLHVYGFGEPGYSIVFLPSNITINNQHVHPNGFVIAFGGGVGYDLTHNVRAVFELGYQIGFQSWSYTTTVLGNSVTTSGDAKDSYLQLGFGLATAFD